MQKGKDGDNDDDNNGDDHPKEGRPYYILLSHFSDENTEAHRGEAACPRSHSMSEANSGLEPRVPSPSSELSLLKDPTSKVREERQVLLSPGDASVCQ